MALGLVILSYTKADRLGAMFKYKELYMNTGKSLVTKATNCDGTFFFFS